MLSIMTLIIGFCLLTLFGQWRAFDILVWICIVSFSVAFMIDISLSKKYRPYQVPLACGLLLRVFLLLYDLYTDNPLHLPHVGGALSSDPLRFYNTAIESAQGYKTVYGGFFSRFLGFFFRVMTPSRLLAEYIVLLFSIATILAFANILLEINVSQHRKVLSVYLISLLPNYAFMSAILRRETVISFFVSLSILYFIKWLKGDSTENNYILAFVFALVASLFHAGTGLIIASYIFFRIIYSPKRKTFTLDPENLIIAVFFVGIAMFLYGRFGTVLFNKIEKRLSSGNLVTTRDDGGSSYAKYVGDARTPIRMIVFFIPRLLYFMFSPFPWQWRGISDIISFSLSSFVYLLIILRAFKYIRYAKKDDENRLLLVALLFVLLLSAAFFSWGVSNTGTAIRHRDKFIAIIATLFALSERNIKRKTKYYLT